MTDDHIYRLIKLMLMLLGNLPRSVLRFFSDGFGLVWHRIDARHRKIVLENIDASYPGRFSPEQLERFSIKVFKNIASILFEVIWAYGKPREKLFAHFEVKGLAHLANAQKKGKGVILLTCHLGNFELLVAALPKAGIETPYGIYRRFDFVPLERLMLEMRQRFGARLIAMGGMSRKLQTVLRNKGVMGTLFDQNANWHNGISTLFFGRPACSRDSLAKLVSRSGAVVVPMFMVRQNETYIIEFLPEIPWQTTGCPIKDIENNTQNYVTAVELMVRKCPEQYFWVHNRWKTKHFSLLKSENCGK